MTAHTFDHSTRVDINQDIRYLMTNKDYFYGYFLAQLNRRPEYDVSKCPTAAIEIRESGATLIYNPDFWAAHDIAARVDFLKHECAHFIMGHIPLARELMHGKLTGIFNIAADLAVNSLIPTFPNKGLLPDGMGGFRESEFCTIANFRKQFPDLEEGKSFKYYLEFLQAKADEMKGPSGGEPGEGDYQFDDHSKWGSDIPKDVQEQIAKQLVGKAVEDANHIGSPESMDPRLRDLIKQLLKPNNQWARELRRFPQDAEAVTLESTRKRVNRRFGVVQPGFKKERKVRIGVGFDVSGSMWDDVTMKRLNNELAVIYKDAELYVMFFDTGITKEQEWDPSMMQQSIPGGGGTLFQPVLDRATALKLDGLIMLTDGMNCDTMTKPRFPVLWGILDEYEYTAPFGRVIKIPKGVEKA